MFKTKRAFIFMLALLLIFNPVIANKKNTNINTTNSKCKYALNYKKMFTGILCTIGTYLAYKFFKSKFNKQELLNTEVKSNNQDNLIVKEQEVLAELSENISSVKDVDIPSKKKDKRLSGSLNSQDLNIIQIGLEIQYNPEYRENLNIKHIELKCGENKDMFNKIIALIASVNDAYETIDILESIVIDKYRLTTDHKILTHACDVYNNALYTELSSDDIKEFDLKDQQTILGCFSLLNITKYNRERIFQFISSEDRKSTPHKTHKKTQKRRVNSGTYKKN